MSFPRILIALFLPSFAIIIAGLWYYRPLKIPAPETSETALPTSQPLSHPLIDATDPVRGPKGAKITIVEFADYRCPHCRSAEKDIQTIRARYPNDVRLIWKDLPVIAPEEEGRHIAVSARCAGAQGKFWEFHDALFDIEAIPTSVDLTDIAQTLRLDQNPFSSCLQNPSMGEIINRKIEEARRLGLTGVPTFFVNGIKSENITADVANVLKK